VEQLPYSPACDNNKNFILDVLRQVFADRQQVLEIASGTGQHACYFAEHMPWLSWQPSEIASNLSTLVPRCAQYQQGNLLPALALDVRADPWPVAVPDAVFGANFLHIISWGAVQDFFERLGRFAGPELTLAVYGPFNYGGEYTSDSNARFDQWLADRDIDSAIRNFEDVNALAREAGLVLQADHEMPANNRTLVWCRRARD